MRSWKCYQNRTAIRRKKNNLLQSCYSLIIQKMLLEKQQQKEEHLLVKKYLKDHSLVESNITSFNNFIDHRMQEIIQELNETMPSEDIEISLGKIKVDRPQIVEADGSTHLITPAEARIRGLT